MLFLTDMGISQVAVDWLRNNNHNAIHLREENLHRMKDIHILEKAKAENRIILTCDLDFAHLMFIVNHRFPSIIILRLNNQKSFNQISKIKNVIEGEALALLNGAIISVTETTYRVRHTPINR